MKIPFWELQTSVYDRLQSSDKFNYPVYDDVGKNVKYPFATIEGIRDEPETQKACLYHTMTVIIKFYTAAGLQGGASNRELSKMVNDALSAITFHSDGNEYLPITVNGKDVIVQYYDGSFVSKDFSNNGRSATLEVVFKVDGGA
jgi:hypothetical protein